MFSQILVPLDGSTIAEQALPFARALALGLNVPIKLLSVIDTGGLLASTKRARRFDQLTKRMAAESETHLKATAHRLAGISVEHAVEQGSAPEIIIETAAKNKTALIAMATHGRSGINQWLLGSVAEKVLRGSNNPLLLVKAGQTGFEGELPLRTLIVPLDGSELAETILPTAVYVACSLGIDLALTRASEIPRTAYYRTDDWKGAEAFIPTYEEVLKASTEEARDYLEKTVQSLQRQGVGQVRPMVMSGPAAETIIDLALRTQGSLIAMCTHGRSGVTRWILGSVTEKVVHHSGSPVLVLRPS